jgi:Arylsulfotransferase (ASST)
VPALLMLLLVGVVLGLGALTSTGTASAGAPAVVISPLPGTLDANPGTQVSFLGAPARDLRQVSVDGTVSGFHTGRLEPYSTGNGASFLPSEPFDPGEQVLVSASVVRGGASEQVRSSFTIGSPVKLTGPGPNKVKADPPDVMHFHSRPDLEPPAVTVSTPAADPAAGDIFVEGNLSSDQAGPMILSPDGQLIYFKRLPRSLTARDVNVQAYHGRPVLTWWQGQIVDGHGQGVDVIESAHYRKLATVRAGNGLLADLHDFVLTPQGTAWITSFAPTSWDLSAYGGQRDGIIDDGVIQEIDIKTGLVMFQWNAIGHVAISDTHMPTPKLDYVPFDFFHVNSIDPQADGSLIVSSRNTWTIYDLNARTGAIEWRVGGRHSSYKLGPGAHFAWQHDAELEPDGTLTVFDNDDAPKEAPVTRAIDISLDSQSDTASLVWARTHPRPEPVLSASQGDVEMLPNGDAFVGWGQDGPFTEFSQSGQLVLDMRFRNDDSYRAFRHPWAGHPLTRPALVASRSAGGETELYASWNGATDVAAWSILAGSSPRSLARVASQPASGFETAMRAPGGSRFVQVRALSASGEALGSSRVVRVQRRYIGRVGGE